MSAGRWYKDLSPNSWHVLGRHTCPLIQVPIVGLLTVLACNEAQGREARQPAIWAATKAAAAVVVFS